MKRFVSLLLLTFSTFFCFAEIINYDVVGKGNGNNNTQIAISPNDKTRENLVELGDYFRKLNKNSDFAWVYIYDDIKAAKMYERIDTLNDADSAFYDKHFIAIFWKGNGEGTRYNFTIMLDGLNGKTETIEYDRKEDVEKQDENTEEAQSNFDIKSQYNQNTLDKVITAILMFILIGFPIAWIILLINWKRWKESCWFDFAVAFFMGTLGVQKFREKRYVLGVFYILTVGFFLVGWLIDCIRYVIYAARGHKFSPKQKDETHPRQKQTQTLVLADDEPLPVLTSASIVLQKEEVCHLAQPANYVVIKNVVVGRKSSGGRRSTTFLGVRYSGGQRYSKSIRGNVAETTPGQLFITSKRIVFTAMKGAFNKKLTEITAITPYADSFIIQFGEKTFTLQTENAPYACQILARLLNDIQNQ